jgi:putative ABC transport system permease protein
MVFSHLKLILRNIRRVKLYALINIIGLAVGLTAVTFIALYINFELSFDRFHVNAERIFRVTRQFNHPGGYQRHFARVPETWINDLPDVFPEIEDLIRFQAFPIRELKIDDFKMRDEKWFVTDPNVFEVFSFKLLQGDPATALVNPYCVVITEAMAIKLFGNTDVLNREIQVVGNQPGELTGYKITGVMRDVPKNSHIDIHFLASYRSPEERQDWAYVYLLLKPDADFRKLAGKFPDFLRRYIPAEELPYSFLRLQRLTDIHLHSHLDRELQVNGDVRNIYILAVVALLMLAIACFNFMNLSTARFGQRAKETGIRKILGANRRQMIGYYLLEAITYAILAGILALILVELLFPGFNRLVGNILDTNPLHSIPSIFLFAGLILMTGIVAGIYPAMFLTSVDQLLLGSQSQGGATLLPANVRQKRGVVRKILIVLQFIISITLVICAIVNYQQYRYLRNKKLGFRTDQTIVLKDLTNSIVSKYSNFKAALEQDPDILGITAAMDEPSKPVLDGGFVTVEGVPPDQSGRVVYILPVDDNFFREMQVRFRAGHDFLPQAKSRPIQYLVKNHDELMEYLNANEYNYILNQTAVKSLGLNDPANALGLMFNWQNNFITLPRGPIIGVVDDLYYSSLRDEVTPMVYIYEPFFLKVFIIRIRSGNVDRTLSFIKNTWDRIYPDNPFEYEFMDEMFAGLYRAEKQQGEILAIFSVLAILIAYLGIFGLVTFSTEQRTREIGIRKVLGSTVSQIVFLIGKNFLIWVVIAIAIACSIAYCLILNWLHNFAYRIELSIWPFLLAAILALLITLLTVSWQAIRAATANPVEALRYE